MKATISFDLDVFDDKLAHLQCVKASDMASVIWDFVYNGKKSIEHILEERDFRKMDVDAHDAVQLVFDKFRSILEEHSVNIDDLIV
jgi:hypothetical protein